MSDEPLRRAKKALVAFNAKKREAELDVRFLEVLAEAMDRSPSSETPCRPHAEACEATGRSTLDFIEMLKDEKFREGYTRIMGPPPPEGELTSLWVQVLDSHVSLAKQDPPHPASVTFLLKSLDDRFKPARAGRPSKKAAAAGLSADPAGDAAAEAMWASMMSG